MQALLLLQGAHLGSKLRGAAGADVGGAARGPGRPPAQPRLGVGFCGGAPLVLMLLQRVRRLWGALRRPGRFRVQQLHLQCTQHTAYQHSTDLAM